MNNPESLAPFQVRLAQLGLLPLPEEMEAASSIRLALHPAQEDDLPLGASKIGGLPDLPPQTDWPAWNGAALAFLGQINLADLAGFPTASPLPPAGLLSFFYDAEQSTWGFDPADQGSWRVVYTESGFPLVRRQPPARAENCPVFSSCACEFHEVLQIAEVEPDAKMESLAFSEPAWLEFGEAVNPADVPDDLAHRLLGRANPIQSDTMDLECQLVNHGIYLGDADAYRTPQAEALAGGAKDWRLLFQLDSDRQAKMMWGDSGRLYFWIRADDLAQRRFDQVWMILQCC